eukprot:scaffold96987_cov33-Phaeocystis_antarctica.AAC.1
MLRGRVAERDRLCDFHLVTDARFELEESALKPVFVVVGGEAQITSGARLDLVVNAEFVAADGCDTRADT